MYTAEEKQEIERVMELFHDYIRNSKNDHGQVNCDVIWSESLQCYLWLSNNNKTKVLDENALHVIPIESAKWLFRELTFEFANDVYSAHQFPRMAAEEVTDEMMEQAIKEIVALLAPYLKAMPEYTEIAMKMIIDHAKLYIND